MGACANSPSTEENEQEDCEFEASLDYMVRVFQRKKENQAPL